jgi:hypothetical protein
MRRGHLILRSDVYLVVARPPGALAGLAAMRARAAQVYNDPVQSHWPAPCGGAGWRRLVHLTNTDPRLLAALVPLVLIELGMKVYCIVDLYRPDRRVKGDTKLVWLLVILLISTVGWVAYLLVGRED